METRSKTKGVPQEVLTTSFVEEVTKTHPTICHAAKTTHFSVAVKEPDYPTPIANLPTPKTPKSKNFQVIKPIN
jgi:hypothetical protein